MGLGALDDSCILTVMVAKSKRSVRYRQKKRERRERQRERCEILSVLGTNLALKTKKPAQLHASHAPNNNDYLGTHETKTS